MLQCKLDFVEQSRLTHAVFLKNVSSVYAGIHNLLLPCLFICLFLSRCVPYECDSTKVNWHSFFSFFNVFLIYLYVSGRFCWDSTALSQRQWSSGRTRWLTQRRLCLHGTGWALLKRSSWPPVWKLWTWCCCAVGPAVPAAALNSLMWVSTDAV